MGKYTSGWRFEKTGQKTGFGREHRNLRSKPFGELPELLNRPSVIFLDHGIDLAHDVDCGFPERQLFRL